MSFYNPLVLYGLIALAIPVIIHLFNFRRTKKIYFSSTQFLEQVAEESTSKLKIKHWLILIARLLFILFLVLAFAQPFIPANKDEIKGQNVFIYLDNSFSMSNQVSNDVRALDEGIKIVDGLSELFPPETQYVFQTSDFIAGGNSYKSRNELSDLLTEVTYSGSYRSLNEITERFGNLDQRGLSGIWYFISDFQNSTIGEIDLNAIDSSQKVNLIPIYFETRKNLFVDTVYLKNPFSQENDKTEIVVELQNSGIEDIDDAGVRVFVDSIQTAGTVVNVPGNSRARLEFDLGFGNKTISKGRIAIEEYPVTFDNEFFFTLNKTRKIRVFEIREDQSQPFIEDVFGNQTLFDFKSNQSGNVNYSLLNEADFIILNGVNSIPVSLINSIKSVVNNGVSLLLIPGRNPDINSYQNLIEISLSLSDSLVSFETSTPDFENPFFSNVFEDEVSNIAMFSATPVIDWGLDRTALITYRNGKPFLNKVVVDQNIYLVSSPLENDLNGFQNHALFVPVMYKLAFSSMRLDEPLYYSLKESLIPITLDSVEGRNIIYRLRSDNLELIPDQRLSGNKLMIEIPPEVIETGFYYLTDDKGTDIKLLSFNSDKRESMLDQQPLDKLQTIADKQSNVELLAVNNSDDFISEFRSSVDAVPLWKYALILSLLFLLSETLIIRFFD